MNGSHGPNVFLPSRIYKVFLILLFGVSLYLGFSIIEPFIHTMIFASVLTVLFSPIFNWFLIRTQGRRSLASFITVCILVFCLLLPMTFLILALISQGVESLVAVNHWISQLEPDSLTNITFLEKCEAWVHHALPFVQIDAIDIQGSILEYSKSFAQTMLAVGTEAVRNAAKLVLHFLLMIFIVFHFLRDGAKMVDFIKYLSPLRSRQEDYIIDSLKRVARGVLMGCLLVAALQGIAGGIGLAIAGIPAYFWGAMMALASLVPVVGTGLVWVPAVIYLVIAGHWQMAIFLALWCGLFVVSIDTVLRPIFMREASRVSTLYIFLAILGGVSTFGMLGIFYGPLILSLVMVMLHIYMEEYAEDLREDGEG